MSCHSRRQALHTRLCVCVCVTFNGWFLRDIHLLAADIDDFPRVMPLSCAKRPLTQPIARIAHVVFDSYYSIPLFCQQNFKHRSQVFVCLWSLQESPAFSPPSANELKSKFDVCLAANPMTPAHPAPELGPDGSELPTSLLVREHASDTESETWSASKDVFQRLLVSAVGSSHWDGMEF